jgi:hypothetical protein
MLGDCLAEAAKGLRELLTLRFLMHGGIAQVLAGNFTFRSPQQSINAAAPSAAYNLTLRQAAEAQAAQSNMAPTATSLALPPSPANALANYTVTATKNSTTSYQGPQPTDQVSRGPSRTLPVCNAQCPCLCTEYA